jgi:GNAT superfamily N-acetyltransferase
MQIKLAETDEAIDRCFAVMVQLRPQHSLESYRAAVARQMQQGYRLAYVEDGGDVCAVAGFRIDEMLHRGRAVYVDDLVTDAARRSQGYGDQLFDWLVEYARINHCQEFHLDSGVQRFAAHRFYFRKRMAISSYHFVLKLE